MSVRSGGNDMAVKHRPFRVSRDAAPRPWHFSPRYTTSLASNQRNNIAIPPFPFWTFFFVRDPLTAKRKLQTKCLLCQGDTGLRPSDLTVMDTLLLKSKSASLYFPRTTHRPMRMRQGKAHLPNTRLKVAQKTPISSPSLLPGLQATGRK
jgi:hypothetical protein